MKRLLGVIVALALVTGCGLLKKKGGDDAGTAAAPADTAATATTETPAADASVAVTTAAKGPDVHNIPSPADHEQKAAQEITKANYKDELDKLEKEVKANK